MVESLLALRETVQQRLAEEHAALEAAALARHQARAQAAQQARDAGAARLAAARAVELATAQARAEAERAQRLRIAATAAAERALRMIALDEDRLAKELALRREVVRRTRPRWMCAVTAIAVLAALGLGGFAVDRQLAADAALRSRERALDEGERARRARQGTRDTLDMLTADLAAQRARIDAAIQRGIAEQAAADHRANLAEQQRARQHKAERDAQRRRRQAERAHQQRVEKLVLPAACANNTLC